MTKGIYKPTFVFVVALIFMLTAQAAVSASETEGESVMNYRSDKFWL
jgi:hypothetical protein